MDKSVIIFVLFAVAFAAAAVGGVMFVTARRLPKQLRTTRLSNAARLIDGHIAADGGFDGTYKGKQVQLRLGTEQPLPYLHIALQPVAGAADWQLTTGPNNALSLKAAHDGLADALLAAGLKEHLTLLRLQRDLALTYRRTGEPSSAATDDDNKRGGVLECSYQLNDAFAVPGPEAFAAQLDALLAVAKVIEQTVS